MVDWFQKNQLVLNSDKTKIIKFTSTASVHWPLNLVLHSKSPQEVDMVKFPGLQLDNRLMYKAHIDSLLHKLTTVCFLMRKLYYILNINGLKIVYYAYYQSPVKYGIIYWGNTADSNKVSVLQKKMIRIMLGVGPTHSCRKLFKQLNILPIPCVYIFSLMMFVVNNLDNFQPNNSMHLSSFQKGVYYSGVKLFNSLPKNNVDNKHDKTI
jgi:hypothetical protein